MFPTGLGWSTLTKELTVATRIKQSSDELSTSVSESTTCKQMKVDTYAKIPELTLSRRLHFGGVSSA